MISAVSSDTPSIASTSASMRSASCTGAQTVMPLSVAAIQAIRSISAPFAWSGKFRMLRGLASVPVRTVHPNVE